MRLTECARLIGVSPDTLRRWERRGLVSPTRDWAGHRRFSPEDIAAIRRLVLGNAPRLNEAREIRP